MPGINTYEKSPIQQGPKRKGYQQDALFAPSEFVPSDEPERGISLHCSSGRAGHDFRPARPEAFVREHVYVAAIATPVECALTQKPRGRGAPKDFYVEPRTSARHSAFLMLSSRAPNRGTNAR